MSSASYVCIFSTLSYFFPCIIISFHPNRATTQIAMDSEESSSAASAAATLTGAMQATDMFGVVGLLCALLMYAEFFLFLGGCYCLHSRLVSPRTLRWPELLFCPQCRPLPPLLLLLGQYLLITDFPHLLPELRCVPTGTVVYLCCVLSRSIFAGWIQQEPRV